MVYGCLASQSHLSVPEFRPPVAETAPKPDFGGMHAGEVLHLALPGEEATLSSLRRLLAYLSVPVELCK